MILPLWIAAVLFVTIPGQAAAQASATPDPRDAQPERPTVATHAFTVSRGYFELETGFQRQSVGAFSNYLAMPLLLKVGLGSRVQLDIAPGWRRNADNGKAMSGLTDARPLTIAETCLRVTPSACAACVMLTPSGSR